jgi:hypothetical protein
LGALVDRRGLQIAAGSSQQEGDIIPSAEILLPAAGCGLLAAAEPR